MAVAKEQIRQIISKNNISSVADIYALLKESFKDILQELAESSVHIVCIQPGEDYTGEKGNEASMVLAVTCGEFDMLFTGDVEG